jgi:hypothetical protein
MRDLQSALAYLRLIESDIRRIVKTPLPDDTRRRIDAMIEFCTLHCAYSSEAKRYLEHLAPGSIDRKIMRRKFESAIASFEAFEHIVSAELHALELLYPEAATKES